MDLRTFLADTEMDPPTFAEAIGVTTASVYRYIAGDRKPRPEIMQRIASATKGRVQPNDFFAPDQAVVP